MAAELLDRVGIPDAEKRVKQYPFEFSGGMRQRAMIAMAISCNPDILIADEPTTALDVTIQAQIIEVVREMQEQYDSGVILITHDLGVVAEIADKVMVMYGGRTVEYGPDRRDLLQPAPPVHVGPAGLAAASRPRREDAADAHQGPAAGPHPLPAGCPFAGAAPTSGRSAATTGRRSRSSGRSTACTAGSPATEREAIRAALPHFRSAAA